MDKLYFNCPECGEQIAADSYDDIFDVSIDYENGHYIEFAAYYCPHCYSGDIVAENHYTLKFDKIVVLEEED